ncbi:C-type lectin domain family 10 member A-like [Mya arenaria]|uniref:C-type lectin domain family 10 member A-like n=1 Tax=Mya arenaria TaxID=6604 RepID=UPI0022E0330D|nr:C-type lectin domain family 10 member A-like [Mya arenaria]
MSMLLMLVCIFGVQSALGKTLTVCPDGWLANNGSCYLFCHVENEFVFSEAESYCYRHNSHLVHVNNSDENEFLKDRLRRFRRTLKQTCTYIYTHSSRYVRGWSNPDNVVIG